MQDDVLGHDARLELAFEPEMHGLRHLEQQLAGAHDKAGVGVADAGGEFVERPGHAGVGIGAEEVAYSMGAPKNALWGTCEGGHKARPY